MFEAPNTFGARCAMGTLDHLASHLVIGKFV